MSYNPVYNSEPFTSFESIEPSTPLATLNFNWRERDIPEKQRTKHVHRLHPYLGKVRVRPDWSAELTYVLEGESDEVLPATVICDVYAEDQGKEPHARYAFELKAPLPNSDQTKVSKEKILKLYAMEPVQVDGAYYALPYNPYGERKAYNRSFPARWFNMKEDPVVLIGDEFWEKIGGMGTYQAFIDAVNEIAPEYKERIYREYLGIDPPQDSKGGQL